jgi:hypothetical protein
LMIARGQGRPFFSDAFCAAIAALKFRPKRSHTFTYGSRYWAKFCLALTTQKAPETFPPEGMHQELWCFV